MTKKIYMCLVGNDLKILTKYSKLTNQTNLFKSILKIIIKVIINPLLSFFNQKNSQ